MNKNRQFELMAEAARVKLRTVDPKDLADMTGLSFDGKAFKGVSLGVQFSVLWPEYIVTPSLGFWHDLTLLQYLANTKGAPLTGRFISMADFVSGGLARGTSFDRANDLTISRIGAHSESDIRETATRLGAVVITGKADLTLLFSFLPKIPMKLNLWLADEEFPASGKVLFDASADRDLGVEAAGVASGVLLSLLEEKLRG